MSEDSSGGSADGTTPQNTLIGGSTPGDDDVEAPAGGSAEGAPARKVKGQTLAGGSTRGQYWSDSNEATMEMKPGEPVDPSGAPIPAAATIPDGTADLDRHTMPIDVEEVKMPPSGPPPSRRSSGTGRKLPAPPKKGAQKKGVRPPPPPPSKKKNKNKKRPKPPLKKRGSTPPPPPARKRGGSEPPPPPKRTSEQPRGGVSSAPPPLPGAPNMPDIEQAPVTAPMPAQDPPREGTPPPPQVAAMAAVAGVAAASAPPAEAPKKKRSKKRKKKKKRTPVAEATPPPAAPDDAPPQTVPLQAQQPRPRVAAAMDVAVHESPPPAPVMELRSVAQVCETELGLKPEPLRAARLQYELGRDASDKGAQLRHFRGALEAAPDYLPAIRAARALQLERKNVKGAALLFDAEIKLAPSNAAQAWLHFEKGCALIDVDGDVDAARKCFAEAARLDGANATLLKAVRHAEQRAKDWSSLSQALEATSNAVGDDVRHRAAVLVERGRLLERRLSKSDAAIDAYQQALAIDPTTPIAMQELKRLLYTHKRWRELVGVYEREAQLTSDTAVQALAWWNISRIHSERLGSRNDAIAALENAAKINSADPALLEELARMYEDAAHPAGVASALERLAAAVARAVDKVAVYQRLAELHDREGGDSVAAVRWYEAALSIDAGFVPALRALDRLYAKIGNWEALAAIYVAEGAAAGPSPKRGAAYTRAADIFDSKLGRPAGCRRVLPARARARRIDRRGVQGIGAFVHRGR